MRRKTLVALFFVLFFSLQAQTNRALFVGIDRYPQGSGWLEIHATNDYKLISFMLLQSGYKVGNIKALLNEKATKAVIVKELKNLAKESVPGDYIYIHFSCHGQQMADDNGDEFDGFDEALIPYDAQQKYEKGKYEGENHLRDDELEILLGDVRKKIGPKGNLIVVLDACSSGTGTRYGDDDEYIRGTNKFFTPEKYVPKPADINKLNLHLKHSKFLSPITVFSACQPYENNSECIVNDVYYGTLSYAFYMLAPLYSKKISNREFLQQLLPTVKKLIEKQKNKQTPYFESTDERKIFQIGR